MKNTIRVRRNGGKNNPSSQSKIESEAARQKELREQAEWDASIAQEFALPTSGDFHPSCLAIVDRETMGLVSKIPLSEDDFYSVLSQNRGEKNAGKFIAQAIREKLERPEDDGFTELETTYIKVSALLQLLADKFEHLARVDGCEFSGEQVNRFCGGVGLLVADAQAALNQSFITAFRAAQPQRAEVKK